MAAETPCSVLYNDIRSFGGLKHLEIARMLINGNSYLGSTLLEKCSSNRSYLTRYIVHRKPDQCAPAIYSDFSVTTLNLSAAIYSKLGGGESAYQAIAEHYRGPAANEMMSALASYKLDSRLYANALNRIDNFDGNAVREKKARFTLCSLWQRGRSPIPFRAWPPSSAFATARRAGTLAPPKLPSDVAL
ncbi:MAG: hypothetical protein U0J89_05130 [Collinsella sp.]|nr:hypothetical protein [Collinsella sp.]